MPAREQLPGALKGMERFRLYSFGNRPEMKRDDDGMYVRLSDVAAALSYQEGKLREALFSDEALWAIAANLTGTGRFTDERKAAAHWAMECAINAALASTFYQDGDCELCGGSGDDPNWVQPATKKPCPNCRGTGNKPRADHD